jgi:hypothetical protein
MEPPMIYMVCRMVENYDDPVRLDVLFATTDNKKYIEAMEWAARFDVEVYQIVHPLNTWDGNK